MLFRKQSSMILGRKKRNHALHSWHAGAMNVAGRLRDRAQTEADSSSKRVAVDCTNGTSSR